MNLVNPFLSDRASGFAALPSNNCPIDARKIDGTHRSNQWFKRNKPNGSGSFA